MMCDRIWKRRKGDNPLCLHCFPSYDLYVYASTQAILFSYWSLHYPPSGYRYQLSDEPADAISDFDAGYLEDLKMAAGAYGYSPEPIDAMFQSGYTPEEIEDLLYCCCGKRL